MGYQVAGNNCIAEVGAASATVVSPSSISANTGNLMLMFVAYTKLGGVSATISTPSGWTVQSAYPKTVGALRVYVFKRIATADGESFPDLTISDATNRWSIIGYIFDDADTTTDPFSLGDFQTTTTTSYTDHPDITLVKTRSWVISYNAWEDGEGAAPTNAPANFVLLSSVRQSTGTTEGIDHTVTTGIDFAYNTAGSTFAGIDWGSNGDDSCAVTFEVLTNGSTAPAKIDTSPLTVIPTADYTQGTDLTWIDAIVNSGTLPNGSTVKTWNFDASVISTPLTFNTGTSVDGTLETVSISGHNLITGMTVYYSKNGGTAVIGLTEGGRYYIRKIDVNTFSLWTDRSDCISNVTTTRVDLTASGSETHQIRQYAINLPAHAMDESMIVRIENNGNTLPTGLTHNSYYWVRPINTDYIQLCGPVTGNVDTAGDYYYNSTDASVNAQPVALTAAGTGTCIVRECRIFNSISGDTVVRASGDGSSSNKGPAPGTYLGDLGTNQNWSGYSRTFATPRDMSTEVLAFFAYFITCTQTDIGNIILIDSDGDWMSWRIADKNVKQSTSSGTNILRQLQPGSKYIQSISEREVGTFNSASVKHMVFLLHYVNKYTTRPGANPFSVNDPYVISPCTVYGGIANDPLTLNDAVSQMVRISAALAVIPSELQFVLNGSLQIGDGTKATYFVDSEKSIAFPPLANGTTKLYNYRETIGFDVNAAVGDRMELKNSQIGASAPFRVSFTVPTSGQYNFDGNTYVLGNVVLDSDLTYNRQLFVGGDGITDNGAIVRSSTFIVGTDVGVNNGLIAWNSITNIASSAFEMLTTVTSGHAITIDTSGSYTFTDLTFTNFGVNGSSTAAVYNKSGGVVTININGGSTPTYRDSAGSTTNIVAGASVTLTGLIAGSEIRAYLGTDPATATDIDGVETSGTSFTFTQSVAGQDGYIVIFALGYLEQIIHLTYSDLDVTIPITQQTDRQYNNPA